VRGRWLGRLEAPRLGLSATVLEGSDDDTLSRAAGHVESTADPGRRGNVAIAGHRDTVFRPLQLAKLGDDIQLVTADSVYAYRITRIIVVNPSDVYVLDDVGRPLLTLITCYPFGFVGAAPQRFIAQADLVDVRARREEAKPAGEASPASGAR
jgi:sortase A